MKWEISKDSRRNGKRLNQITTQTEADQGTIHEDIIAFPIEVGADRIQHKTATAETARIKINRFECSKSEIETCSGIELNEEINMITGTKADRIGPVHRQTAAVKDHQHQENHLFQEHRKKFTAKSVICC